MSSNHLFSFSSSTNRSGSHQKEDSQVHLDNLHNLGLLPKKAVKEAQGYPSRMSFPPRNPLPLSYATRRNAVLRRLKGRRLTSTSLCRNVFTIVPSKWQCLTDMSDLTFQITTRIIPLPEVTRLSNLTRNIQDQFSIDKAPISRATHYRLENILRNRPKANDIWATPA